MKHHLESFFGKSSSLFNESQFTPPLVDMLKRREEWETQESRDEWGNWDIQFSKLPNVEIPVLDMQARSQQKPAWPGGATFAVCITHDIDTLDHFSWREYRTRILRAPFLAKIKSILGFIKNRVVLRRTNAWSFETWLALERKYGVRATWYVPPEDPVAPDPDDCSYHYSDPVLWTATEQVPFADALKRLVQDEKHEVGLHGSISAYDDAAELKRQRTRLGEVVGSEITSLRMHYLRFDPILSPSAVSEAGFESDSTYGFNRGIGFRAGTSFPFRMYDPATSKMTSVIEVPFCVQDGSLFRSWCLDLSPDTARSRCQKIFDSVAQLNGVVNLVFHPNHENEPLILAHFEWCLAELRSRNACFITISEAARIISG